VPHCERHSESGRPPQAVEKREKQDSEAAARQRSDKQMQIEERSGTAKQPALRGGEPAHVRLGIIR